MDMGRYFLWFVGIAFRIETKFALKHCINTWLFAMGDRRYVVGNAN